MTTEEIKDYIKNYWSTKYPEDGSEYTDSVLQEIITEADRVYSEIVSGHRWYDDVEVVVKIGDKLFKYYWYHVTGDNSIHDMGLEFDWSLVSEVESYETIVIRYKEKK